MEKSASDFGSLRVFFVVVTVALTADQNSNRVGAIPAAWHQHLQARRGNAKMPRHIALAPAPTPARTNTSRNVFPEPHYLNDLRTSRRMTPAPSRHCHRRGAPRINKYWIKVPEMNKKETVSWFGVCLYIWITFSTTKTVGWFLKQCRKYKLFPTRKQDIPPSCPTCSGKTELLATSTRNPPPTRNNTMKWGRVATLRLTIDVITKIASWRNNQELMETTIHFESIQNQRKPWRERAPWNGPETWGKQKAKTHDQKLKLMKTMENHLKPKKPRRDRAPWHGPETWKKQTRINKRQKLTKTTEHHEDYREPQNTVEIQRNPQRERAPWHGSETW